MHGGHCATDSHPSSRHGHHGPFKWGPGLSYGLSLSQETAAWPAARKASSPCLA